MKSVVLKFSTVCCIALLAVSSTFVTSCKKDQTCHAYITVNDTANHKVQGATVVLDANNVGGQVTYHGTTDGAGNITFDIALPAIFYVTATKANFPLMYGKGLVNVDEPRKEAWLTVKIQ